MPRKKKEEVLVEADKPVKQTYGLEKHLSGEGLVRAVELCKSAKTLVVTDAGIYADNKCYPYGEFTTKKA